jgi:hypothetical protein
MRVFGFVIVPLVAATVGVGSPAVDLSALVWCSFRVLFSDARSLKFERPGQRNGGQVAGGGRCAADGSGTRFSDILFWCATGTFRKLKSNVVNVITHFA